MCDTAVVVRGGQVLFAKNSDRDPNESQLLEWHPRRNHGPGTTLACTWIDIPQARETHAVLLSRPFWMWGAEIGANEHGVVIGNEAVFTRAPGEDRALLGMDLVRLGLERATSAAEAVEVIARLLEIHGQGGGCGHENRGFRYDNSFVVADPKGAFVLETAGRQWTVLAVRGGRSISNALTLEPFAKAHSDTLKSRVAGAEARRMGSEVRVRRARNPRDMMDLLRDHGASHREHGEPRSAPVYSPVNGAMAGPCVHAGGMLAASQTTASWVAELSSAGVRHWVTGTAAPCTGLFKPVRVAEPLALGPAPSDRADDVSLWWRHERLQRRVARDPQALLPLFQADRDDLEDRWIASTPEPAKAFAEGDRLLADWTARVVHAGAGGTDRRPWWVRRYWRTRNRRAALAL